MQSSGRDWISLSPSSMQIYITNNQFFIFFLFLRHMCVCTDITIELRALGVPWTLHCWMHALAAAHELRLDTVIDQLLQDFLQVCPDDYSQQFVAECLPLLFSIFRYSKVCVSNNFELLLSVSSHHTLLWEDNKRHYYVTLYRVRMLLESPLS